MTLPWVQVDRSAFTRAEELAAVLGIGVAEALGHLVLAWRWALDLGPEDQPPTGRAAGPVAMIRLEAAARWRGERGALFQALVDLGLSDGIPTEFRVKGLDRYATAVSKKATDRERKRLAAVERQRIRDLEANRGGAGSFRALSVPSPEDFQRNSDGKRGEAQGKTKTKTKTKIEKEEEEKHVAPPASGDEEAQVEAFASDTPAIRGPRVADLQAIWNRHPALPRWLESRGARLTAAKARLGDRPLYGTPESWESVIARLAASSFATGQVQARDGRAPWKAGPDFLLRPDSAIKILEGAYDDREAPRNVRASDGVVRQATGEAACVVCGELHRHGQAWERSLCALHADQAAEVVRGVEQWQDAVRAVGEWIAVYQGGETR